MPVTSNWSIFYRNTATPASLETESATQATSIENALTAAVTDKRQIQTFKWANTAARTAQAGMLEGDIGDQADTEQRWRYNGSIWVNITTGLFPVIPTSVAGTGVSVGAGGKVTFTTTTAVNVNGCFTSAYENYRVRIKLTAKAAAVDHFFKLRAAGADIVGAFYSPGRLYTSSTVASTASSAVTQTTGFALDAGGNSVSSTVLEIEAPALAEPTIMHGTFATQGGSNLFTGVTGSTYNAVTTADGFSLTCANNLTGTVRIYGYNDN